MTHVLDQPVWSALNSRQAHLRKGGPGALRFPVDVSPLAGGDDAAVLAVLIPEGDDISLLQQAPPPAPASVTVLKSAVCLQMIAPTLTPATREIAFETLTDADAPEMLALA
ncbi:MAG: GNAT family N-acetyltransferase, partial [Pseudomonadota bacterium]